jgi:hypothetical protein
MAPEKRKLTEHSFFRFPFGCCFSSLVAPVPVRMSASFVVPLTRATARLYSPPWNLLCIETTPNGAFAWSAILLEKPSEALAAGGGAQVRAHEPGGGQGH